VSKPRVATVWLSGCAGCHMSFLDLDEWLFELAQAVDIVYSPIADVKEFPEGVDVTLVEGAVANADNLELLLQLRERSKLVVAFGDCAVHGNVSACATRSATPARWSPRPTATPSPACTATCPTPRAASCRRCCRA
jgi:coenzyme F420-reducing hydrogenase gamma subunit